MVINMDLKELYKSIDNPLTYDTVSKLVDAYSESMGNVYNSLIHYHSKNIPKENNSVINPHDKNLFFANCFNVWKRYVLSMSRDEFISLVASGSYDNDFIKLRNYLKHVPDVHSFDEMNEVFFGNSTPDDIKDLFDKYNWSASELYGSWIHVKSRYLFAKRTRHTKTEHRLYINTDSKCLYKIINLFIKKCLQRQIPFYFKFALDDGSRDDTIPIYSDSENLLNYIEILKEIKREHPEIDFYEPPLLTGKIDGFIGYGSEPDEKVIGKKDSFNNLRANLIEKTINHHRDVWIKKHIDDNFGSREKPVTLTQMITIRAVNNYVDKLLEKYESYIRMENNRRKHGHGDLSKTIEQSVYEGLHYNPQIIKTIGFKNRLYQSLYKTIDLCLRTNCDFRVNIDINGIDCRYSKYDLNNTLVKFTGEINKHDPSFTEGVKNDIRNNCVQYGIIPDKFCFDSSRVLSMKNTYAARKKRDAATYVNPRSIVVNNEIRRMIAENPSSSRVKYDKKI